MAALSHNHCSLERISQAHFVAILFLPEDNESRTLYEGQFTKLCLPEAFERMTVKVCADDPLCQHFGITEAPALVIAYKGMLLAMIDECEQEACDWLVEFARQQAMKL